MTTPTNKLERVCVIDDDKIHHFLLKKTIQLQGLTKDMRFFFDGSQAINFLSENLGNASILPDVIFLDLNMPVMNGWQFLQQYALIKSSMPKDIKIYVVSSSVDQREISQAISIENVCGYIEKPFKPQELRSLFSDTSSIN
jgi:CheY-like chemotaxis protein